MNLYDILDKRSWSPAFKRLMADRAARDKEAFEYFRRIIEGSPYVKYDETLDEYLDEQEAKKPSALSKGLN